MKIPFAKTFSGKDIGCIIDCSHWPADDLNAKTIRFATEYGFDIDAGLDAILTRWDNEELNGDDSQILSDAADESIYFLNDSELPSFCSFYFEENSLFLSPSLDMAREDVGFISSKSQEYPNDDYDGEWLHISDHGNATLYNRGIDNNGKIVDDEIWSIV